VIHSIDNLYYIPVNTIILPADGVCCLGQHVSAHVSHLQVWFNKELMEGVESWLSPQVADIFDRGIEKLIPQHDKCLNSGDKYAEQ
jgi:hypothetical protein